MTDKFLEDHAVAAGLSGTSAKGYAEAAKTIDRLIRQWISDFRNLIDKNSRDNAENIRIQLSDLHFVSDEFRLILNKVADGEVGSREVENLADMLQSTATDVNATLLTLKEEHRKFLNKRYGVGFWDDVDTDVREMKFNIRSDILNLSTIKGAKEKKAEAKRILKKIEKFNKGLVRICERMQPPQRPGLLSK